MCIVTILFFYGHDVKNAIQMITKEEATIIKLKVKKKKTLIFVPFRVSSNFGGSVNCSTFLRCCSMNIQSIIKFTVSFHPVI